MEKVLKFKFMREKICHELFYILSKLVKLCKLIEVQFPILRKRSLPDFNPLICSPRRPLALCRGRILMSGFIRFLLCQQLSNVSHQNTSSLLICNFHFNNQQLCIVDFNFRHVAKFPSFKLISKKMFSNITKAFGNIGAA